MPGLAGAINETRTFKWKPTRNLAAVATSWCLVVGTLSLATYVATPQNGGLYFVLYGLLGATLFGVCLPLAWAVVIEKRSVCDLGISGRHLGLSLALQLVFASLQYSGTLAHAELPPLTDLLPLIALALGIGFFEAVFWRGWVLLQLEEAFGILPAIVLSSVMYAVYHVGYGMTGDEMVFLFYIGVMYATAFRLTRNIFVLWPFFQPMGQLFTLSRDGLVLPPIAALGFMEVLALMAAAVWLASRYARGHINQNQVAKGRC